MKNYYKPEKNSMLAVPVIITLASMPALSAMQGDVGPTSTGSAEISIKKADQARISGIQDLVIADWSIGDGPVKVSSDICIYSSTGSYRVTATGSGSGSSFKITSGSNTLDYTVTWNSGGAGGLNDSGVSLTAGAQSATLPNATTTSSDCNGGGPANSTARVIVGVTEPDMIAAASSSTPYTGTLTMVVAPF